MSLFNERLRQLRDESKLTSAKLAKDLGIAASTLSLYMKDREPNFDTLIKIASYFHVTTDWLIGNSEFRKTVDIAPDPLKLITAMATYRDIGNVSTDETVAPPHKPFGVNELTDSLFPTPFTEDYSIANQQRVYDMISATYYAYHKAMEALFNQKNSLWDNFLEAYDRIERLINLYVDLTHYYTYDIIFSFLLVFIENPEDMEIIESFLNYEKANYRRQHPESFVISEYKDLIGV